MRLIIFSNLLILLLVRLLLKKNIFSKKLGLLTIFLQILALFCLPFLIRLTSFARTFEYFIAFFLTISMIPIILPRIITLLGEERKKALSEIERKFGNFINQILFELKNSLIKNLRFYEILQNLFAKYLTLGLLKIIWLGKEILFLVFFGLPWIAFIITFYIDLYHEFFYWSVYFLAYFFFCSRIFWGLLFIVKNTTWSYFNDFLHDFDKKLYFNSVSFSEILWVNEKFLNNVIFPKNTVINKTLSDWQKINSLILFHLNFMTIKIFLMFYYPAVKTLFFWLNFFAISLGITFYYNFFVGSIYLFILPFLIKEVILKFFTKKSVYENKFYTFCENFDFFSQKIRSQVILKNKLILPVRHFIMFKMPRFFFTLQKASFLLLCFWCLFSFYCLCLSEFIVWSVFIDGFMLIKIGTKTAMFFNLWFS